jgi:hypothetical protein
MSACWLSNEFREDFEVAITLRFNGELIQVRRRFVSAAFD